MEYLIVILYNFIVCRNEEMREMEDIGKEKLPPLLEEIRKLSDKREDVLKYAKELRSINVRMLAYFYPYHDKESKETVKKQYRDLCPRNILSIRCEGRACDY